MSPAGMPCASTVTVPSPDPLARTVIWRAGTAGAGSELMLGQPGLDRHHDHPVAPSCVQLAR